MCKTIGPNWGCDCRFFYASSACIYPEFLQLNTEVEGGGLKESLAWPAQVGVLLGRYVILLDDAGAGEAFLE